jgi:hypothetical protein
VAARRAHNPKVSGSNPLPATNFVNTQNFREGSSFLFHSLNPKKYFQILSYILERQSFRNTLSLSMSLLPDIEKFCYLKFSMACSFLSPGLPADRSLI